MDDDLLKGKMNGTVAAIADLLRFARAESIGCTLLVGAGCSYGAGIPLASQFIKIIEELFPEAYKRAKEMACKRAKDRGEIVDEETFIPTYSSCMAELHPIFRRQLFARYVDKSKINWAHICIASLMKAGYVDRILTTNFDSLIVQACALLGEYPAVYDFASSQILDPHNIPAKAVFHLHGQRTGFVLLNTDEELEKHSSLLGPLMQAARFGRIWIVVGYSGESDPVFEHIANFKPLDNDLFWVGYMSNPPRKHIRERLLNQKSTYYIQGYDADSFFETLTRQLGIFPPDLVARPFSHLEKTLSVLASKEHLIRETRQWIKLAIAQFEKTSSISIITGEATVSLPLNASQQQMDEDLQNLIAQQLQNQTRSRIYADRLAWAYLVLGNLHTARACDERGEAADKLFAEAADRYKIALTHNAQYYESLNNWGVALHLQAKTKTCDTADQLFAQAIEKFQEALALKPDYYEALNNLGASLYEQAKIRSKEGTDGLLTQAIEKFKVVLEIEPNFYQAYNNWGNVLIQQSRDDPNGDTAQLFELAKLKFEKAIYIEPEQIQILNNWGMVLLERRRLSPDETIWEDVDDEVIKISGRSERLRPGGGAYLSACLNALIGDDVGCSFALKKAHKSNMLPSKEYLLKDPNLEGVRDSEWFEVFVADAFEQKEQKEQKE
jgi:tetratricopeptide (TPR) repeat protein